MLVFVDGRPLLVVTSTDLPWGQRGGSSSVLATSAGLRWWQLFVGGDNQAALVVFECAATPFCFFWSSLDKVVAGFFAASNVDDLTISCCFFKEKQQQQTTTSYRSSCGMLLLFQRLNRKETESFILSPSFSNIKKNTDTERPLWSCR